MDNNTIKTKNNSKSGVVKVSHEAPSYYADIAKKWATKTDDKVDSSEYSAKYYANQAKKQAENIQETIESANDLIDGIKTTKTEINELKENSVTAIQTEKDNAVSAIETSKTSAVTAVETVKTQASNDLETEKEKAIKEVQNISDIKIATTEQAGLVKPDGETITINEEGIISSATTSGGGGSWGSIIGTLADQADLVEEFAKYAKTDLSNVDLSSLITIKFAGIKVWTDEEKVAYRQYWHSLTDDKLIIHDATGRIVLSNGFVLCFGRSTLNVTTATQFLVFMNEERKFMIDDWDWKLKQVHVCCVTPYAIDSNATHSPNIMYLGLPTDKGNFDYNGIYVKNFEDKEVKIFWMAIGYTDV